MQLLRRESTRKIIYAVVLGSLGVAAIAGYYFGSRHGVMAGVRAGVGFELAFWLVAAVVLD